MLKAVPKSVHIYLESNPNPNSLKFVVNEMLVPDGMNFDFASPEAAAEAPLAQELFMYPFVDRVFYAANFITVTKKADVEWLENNNIDLTEDKFEEIINQFEVIAGNDTDYSNEPSELGVQSNAFVMTKYASVCQ